MNAMTNILQTRDGYLRLPEVLTAVRIGKSTLYRRIDKGEFPRGYDLGGGAVGWLRSEVEKWIETRPRRGPPR
ncbi:MAG TPA: AlpA family transcriptional regulator [Sphingobium sp.]|uniref:helix-turn-helix transcriptional regulator n=1 Tax=Sphingobium sp. TaxID=1912891 RepID=UPI002ED0BAB5